MEMLGILRMFVSEYERTRKFDWGPTKLAGFLAKMFHDVRTDYLAGISKEVGNRKTVTVTVLKVDKFQGFYSFPSVGRKGIRRISNGE